MLIQIDKRIVHYDLIGADNDPVVCMTHCLSSDGGVWAEQIPALLANKFRVLRLDMRGHGGSTPGPDDCVMADFSNDVARVLDGLGLERVHYIGLSIGGMFGQTLALDHADRVSSLMLCSTSPNAVPGGEGMWLERFNAVRAAGAVDPVADASMERWFTPAFKPRNPRRWKQIRDAISYTSIPGYISAAKAVMKFDVIDKLPRITAPTIVLCGDGDTGTPPAGNKLIAAQIPGARYIEIADARHLVNVERREQFNHIMLDWLAARR